MARFDRSIWSAIGVAEPHHVVADVSGEVIGILDRQSEDVALGGDVGADRLLHLCELFPRLCHVEGGQHADIKILETLARALGAVNEKLPICCR